MPENQKKTPCSKLPKRNQDSKPNSDTTPPSGGQIQRPDMSANDREIEISELTFRQQAALPRIALARSLAQAARDTGVAERTLRRWLEDPSFRQELDRLRQESYDLARQVMKGLGRLYHRATPYGRRALRPPRLKEIGALPPA